MENNLFISAKVHQGGVVYICDENDENERMLDQRWSKDLSNLKVILEKLNFDVFVSYNTDTDHIISLASNLNQFEEKNYKSLLCIIFGHKTNDQIRAIKEAFKQSEALNSKPMIFFNQQEKKIENKSNFTVNFKVIKYVYDEYIEFNYGHHLSYLLIICLRKILSNIETDNIESWLSLNDFMQILSDFMLNAPDPNVDSDSNSETENHDINLDQEFFNSGNRYFNNGEYDQALGVLEKELDLFRSGKINANENIAMALKLLGDIYYIKNNLNQACVYYKQGLEICDRVFQIDGGFYLKSSIFLNLGSLSLMKSDFENGVIYYRQAIEMKRCQFNYLDNIDLADLLNNLGFCYLQKNDKQTAIHYLSESLDMKKRLLGNEKKIDASLATSLNNLGVAYMFHDLKKAEEFTSEALKMRSAIYFAVDNSDLAQSLNNYGAVLLLKGDDLDTASVYLSRGLEMRKRLYKGNTNHPHVVESLNNFKKLNEIKQTRLMIELIKADRNKKSSWCQIL